MKKNREDRWVLIFVTSVVILAAFFLLLTYILLFRTDLIRIVLRYAAAALSAITGVALKCMQSSSYAASCVCSNLEIFYKWRKNG